MKVFEFTWAHGKVETGEGLSPADALNRLGYGGGAVRALDSWREVSDDGQGDPHCPGCADLRIRVKELRNALKSYIEADEIIARAEAAPKEGE